MLNRDDRKRLLLISNSTQFGRGYLDHVEQPIRNLLGPSKRMLFVPYALQDRGGYAASARKRFEAMGYELDSVHEAADPRRAVESAEALFVGGGNTFRLLKSLYDNGLMWAIQRRVEEGMPYLGSSAGVNVACPTIRTTNDMPIVEPPSLCALALLPFQINPHYLDSDPSSTHMGETREQRLREFLEENDVPVVGLREGGWVTVRGEEITLEGHRSARIFVRGREPYEIQPGDKLSMVLSR
ncbi:MAG TPA: dipeptidase PepE [Terriglobales bacterium]|nr:dipeptidase PepE [Terriglobales bacterium]